MRTPFRRIVFAITSTVVVVAFTGAVRAGAEPRDIARLDRAAKPTVPGRYPPEMVVKGDGAFDGSYIEAPGYRSEDRKFSVALWESGPGILRTDSYPHDEYCLVLDGHLIVTNRSGTTEEFGPGDTFVIPKGWAGTWNMTTKFKKQYVAFEENAKAAADREGK
jgi:uncharacterized cupin superfamily protein